MGQRSAVRELTERSGNMDATAKPPLHPLWVLLIAVLLPGVGQVINNSPKRGLMFLFFIMSLGWVTLHLAPPGGVVRRPLCRRLFHLCHIGHGCLSVGSPPVGILSPGKDAGRRAIGMTGKSRAGSGRRRIGNHPRADGSSSMGAQNE